MDGVREDGGKAFHINSVMVKQNGREKNCHHAFKLKITILQEREKKSLARESPWIE